MPAGAAQIHELAALVTSNVRGFVQGLRQAADATRGLRQGWATAARDVGAAADRVATAVGAVGVAVGGMAAKAGFDLLRLEQSAKTSFKTLLGSAAEAEKFLGRMKEFARATPFELPGLIDATRKLLAFGFEAERILPMLRDIGDAAAGMGGDPEVLSRLIRAMGQIRSRGKLTAEEMNQVAEVGISGWQMVADHLGITVPEAMDRTTKGAIDAGTAIEALLAGMRARFGGQMAEQAKTFDGMMSTLKDNLREMASNVFEPLFEGTVRWMRAFNEGFDQERFVLWVAAARDRVADLTARLEAAWPSFLRGAQAITDFLRPLIEFSVRHPEVVAALVAVKASGVMGLTQAVISLGAAVGQTILSLISLRISSVAAQGAMVSAGFAAQAAWAAATLGVSLLVTAVVGAGAAAWAFRDDILSALGPVLEPFREVWEAAKDLGAALWDLASGAVRALWREFSDAFRPVLAEVGSVLNGELVPALRETWRELSAESNPALAELGRVVLPVVREAFRSWASAVAWLWTHGLRRLATLTREWGPWLGRAFVGHVRVVVTAFELMATAISVTIENLQRLMGLALKFNPALSGVVAAAGMIANAAAGSASPPEPATAPAAKVEPKAPFQPTMERVYPRPAPVVPPTAQPSPDQETAAAEQEAREQYESQQSSILAAFDRARRAAMERQASGFGAFRDVLGMEGITGSQVTAIAGQMEGVNPAMAGAFGQAFDQLGGVNADPAVLDQLAANMARIVAEEQRLAEAREVSTQGLQGMAETLNGLRGSLPKEELDAFWNEALGLQQALLDGTIGADQFAASMANLRDRTDEATEAARREALLKGDFKGAGLDFQKALEDRIAAFRMQQFNRGVEAAFNNLFPMADAAGQVTAGFERMHPALEKFGGAMRDTFGRGGTFDPARVASALDTLHAWMATARGQIALITNRIAFLQQELAFASYQERQDIQETIAFLRGELERLLNAPPPFDLTSNDGFFRDPGMPDQQGGGGGMVTIVLPNVTRVSNTEADLLADAVAGSLDRRGRPN